MGFGAFRFIVRPFARSLLSRTTTTTFIPPAKIPAPKPAFSFSVSPFHRSSQWLLPASHSFHSLTDTRVEKTRPSLKSRRKRASIRPKGPHAWVKLVPDEPVPERPTEKVLKRRNEKKRMRLKREFVKSEAKKRKVLVQAAKKQVMIARVERKMAAVARDRAWAIRLAELQQIEEEKNKSRA